MIRLLLCFALLAPVTAHAQALGQRDGKLPPGVTKKDAPDVDEAQPEKGPKKPEFTLADDLDGLFAQLKRARDTKLAERISGRIWETWYHSDSRSIDLLTGWARQAVNSKKYGVALDLLDQVVVLRPNYAEGFNQRATLHFLMKNFSKSIADIERTLALEPRHYGALAGLANILEQIGRKKEALSAWYRVLEVYPAMKTAQSAVSRLEEEQAGRGI